jgi:hypothetical protein
MLAPERTAIPGEERNGPIRDAGNDRMGVTAATGAESSDRVCRARIIGYTSPRTCPERGSDTRGGTA